MGIETIIALLVGLALGYYAVGHFMLTGKPA